MIDNCDVLNYLLKKFKNDYDAGILNGFKSNYAMCWPDMKLLEDILNLVEINLKDDNLNYCDHIINTLTIRKNGDIVLCCYDLTGKIILENINDEPLKNSWNGKLYRELRVAIESKIYLSICNCCNVIKQDKKYIYLKTKGDII
ncbi:SPASM domain-containing protein [Clostridium botulinum]|uniref:SPASM domain-containing protein n=1 Tax=Clostridium botulinum TaxID=1491 RepID=UPI003DA5E938